MKIQARHFKLVKKVPMRITASWSGYRSGQGRIVHREYFLIDREKVASIVEKAMRPHFFTDGTCNYHTASVVKKGEPVDDERLGYSEIIREHFDL